MTPAVCGLDYSTRALNLALIRGPELVYQAEHRLGHDLRENIVIMTRAVEQLANANGGTKLAVYLEKPWMRPEASRGVQKLHAVPTRFETLAVAAGMRVEWVAVNGWHSVILGNGALRSADAKRASIAVVEREFGVRLANDNASDAVCLALYGRQVQRRDELVARAKVGAR